MFSIGSAPPNLEGLGFEGGGAAPLAFAAAPHEELGELARATVVLLAGNEVARGEGGFCPERETRSQLRAFWAS